MNYNYLLCGLHLRFELPWELKITEESRPFLCASEVKKSEQSDLTVKFYPVETLDLPKGQGFWAINSYFVSTENGHKIYHCPARNKTPYCCVEWDINQQQVMSCQFLKGEEHNIAYTKNLMNLLGLEMFLLHVGGLILHSAVVSWNGKGILFSAPSGTGKSTQAALWEEYLGSSTLNGDRAGVRCADGIWTAYGLPFAGTSGIYKNEDVPITAIVLLKQGPENVISRITPMEAFRRLLPECSARRWDRGFMDQLIGILSALIQAVPIYQLECRPDKEAVYLLRDTLMKEE